MPKESSFSSLANHCLIAMPGLAESSFGGSVVFIAEHSPKGALGLVINKPADLDLGTLFERIDLSLGDRAMAGLPVLVGGPVQTDRGFVLHQPLGAWNSTVAVGEDMGLTSSKDVLEAVARGDGPARMVVALGYAGWGPGQLEQEIGANAWLTLPTSAELIFDVPPEQRLERAFRMLGINPAFLSAAAGHA